MARFSFRAMTMSFDRLMASVPASFQSCIIALRTAETSGFALKADWELPLGATWETIRPAAAVRGPSAPSAGVISELDIQGPCLFVCGLESLGRVLFICYEATKSG